MTQDGRMNMRTRKRRLIAAAGLIETALLCFAGYQCHARKLPKSEGYLAKLGIYFRKPAAASAAITISSIEFLTDAISTGEVN